MASNPPYSDPWKSATHTGTNQGKVTVVTDQYGNPTQQTKDQTSTITEAYYSRARTGLEAQGIPTTISKNSPNIRVSEQGLKAFQDRQALAQQVYLTTIAKQQDLVRQRTVNPLLESAGLINLRNEMPQDKAVYTTDQYGNPILKSGTSTTIKNGIVTTIIGDKYNTIKETYSLRQGLLSPAKFQSSMIKNVKTDKYIIGSIPSLNYKEKYYNELTKEEKGSLLPEYLTNSAKYYNDLGLNQGKESSYYKYMSNEFKAESLLQGALNFVAFPFKFANTENLGNTNNNATFLDVVGLGNNEFFKKTKEAFDIATKENYKGEALTNYGIVFGAAGLLKGMPKTNIGVGLGITALQGYQYSKNPSLENLGGTIAAGLFFTYDILKPEPRTSGQIRIETNKPILQENFKVTTISKIGNIQTNTEDFIYKGIKIDIGKKSFFVREANLPESFFGMYYPSNNMAVYDPIKTKYESGNFSANNVALHELSHHLDITENFNFEFKGLPRNEYNLIRGANKSFPHYAAQEREFEVRAELIRMYLTREFRFTFDKSPLVVTKERLNARFMEEYGGTKATFTNIEHPVEFNYNIRFTGNLNFNYNRMQILDSAFGKNALTFSTGDLGFIKRGSQFFNRDFVSFGRNYQERLTGGRKDIFIVKEDSGKLLVKTLNNPFIASTKITTEITSKSNFGIDWLNMKTMGKTKFSDYFFREIKGHIETKYPFMTKGNEFIASSKKVSFAKQKINFDLKTTISSKEISPSFFQSGLKEGSEPFFNKAVIGKLTQVSQIGGETKFDLNSGRNIKQFFYGKSTTLLKQYDLAGFQIETTKIGKKTDILYRGTNLEYVHQPTYDSNTASRGTIKLKNELFTFSKSVQRPELETTKKISRSSISFFKFEELELKPIATIKNSFNEFKLSLQKELYTNNENKKLIIDPFKLAFGKMESEELIKPAKIQASKPSLEIEGKYGFETGISIDKLKNIIPKEYDTFYSFYRSSVVIEQSNILSQTKNNSKNLFSNIININSNKINSELKNNNNLKSPTTLKIDTNLKTSSNFHSAFVSNLDFGNNKPIPLKPNSPDKDKVNIIDIPPPDFSNSLFPTERKKKRKAKTYKRKFSYTPSLTAEVFNIRGKAPKLLTGIELRPIKIRGI